MRTRLIATLTLVMLPLFATVSFAQAPAGADSRQNRREGETARMTGTFRETSDRVTFYPGGGDASYTVLENLALERISNSLTGTRKPRVWDVKAVLTEFKGNNYLLLKQAVMQPLND